MTLEYLFLVGSYILSYLISINLCITMRFQHLSPPVATWHLFTYAYSLHLYLLGIPAVLYSTKPLAKKALFINQ